MQTLVSHSALGSAPLEQPASAQRMHPATRRRTNGHEEEAL